MSGKKLNLFVSFLEERTGLPPARGKVSDAWVYFWVGDSETLLRANEKGQVLRHVSGSVDKKESYQELFVIDEGTTARVAFSLADKPLRRVDVEPQMSSFELKEDLSASLAQLGPIFVPASGRKVIQTLPLAHVRATSAIEALKGDEISLIAYYHEPWRGSLVAEKKAVADKLWHPGTQSFRDVANTPNRGQKRTIVASTVEHFGDMINAVLARPAGSIRRLNIFTHANPGLISLSGSFKGTGTFMNPAALNGKGHPIAGGLDGSVVAWLDVDPTTGHADRNLTSLGLVADPEFEVAKASGRIAPGYPFVVEAPADIPDGRQVRPDKSVAKPARPAP